MVDGMKGELAALVPKLAAQAAATAELLVCVDTDQAEAERVKSVVEVEEAEVNLMQQATKVCPARATPGRAVGRGVAVVVQASK
jgi:ferredoxin